MHGARAVLLFRLTGYRRTWRGSALSSFLTPVLLTVGFGLGVGQYVNQRGALGPVTYLDYLLPGMLASTAVQMALGEAAWPVLSRFVWIRTYHAMIAAPLRIVDILSGDLCFIVLRVAGASTVFLAVGSALGAVHSWWALVTPAVCALAGLAAATPVVAFTARVDSDNPLALLFRFAVIPATLFSGVFFPVSQLAPAVRLLAYASPLWHAVVLCRAATLPGFGLDRWAVLGHLGYLVLWVVAGFYLARRSFMARLIDGSG